MRTNRAFLSALVTAGVAVACADGTAPGPRQPVSVSFTTASAVVATASVSGIPPARPSSDLVGNGALVITKAQLVLARMELVRAGAACGSDTAAGDDDHADDNDCAELELAPQVVELPVNGTVVDALSLNVPAGTYAALEAEVRPIRSSSGRGHGSATFLAAHPELEGVSVLVQGTFNGEPFTFTSDVSTGADQRFDPPLDVTDAPLNVTVHVDLATWFASGANGLIDPRTAGPGTSNAQLVAANIKRSFRAFRDDDHDGRDDHGGQGEQGGEQGEGGHH